MDHFKHRSCAVTSGKPTASLSAGVYIGMDPVAVVLIELASAQVPHLSILSSPPFCFRGRLVYAYKVSPASDELRWFVAGSGSIPSLTLMASGLSKNGLQYQVIR